MAYNQPYVVLPIRNYCPTSSTLCLIQICMVCNEHIWPHQTVTHKSKTYPSNKGLAHLQNVFLNHILHVFCLTFTFNTASSTYYTLYWILVSHHPDDVIIISSSSSLDADLGDEFTQLPVEQILEIINNIKNTCKVHKINNCHPTKMQTMQAELKAIPE